MCSQSKRRVGSMAPAGMDYMLLGAVVGGGAASALVVNQVTKAIFKDDPVKSKKMGARYKNGSRRGVFDVF